MAIFLYLKRRFTTKSHSNTILRTSKGVPLLQTKKNGFTSSCYTVLYFKKISSRLTFCKCNLFLSYHNNGYVPKGNSRLLFRFSALSEIRISLQIILHTNQNIIKSFYVYSALFSELIRKVNIFNGWKYPLSTLDSQTWYIHRLLLFVYFKNRYSPSAKIRSLRHQTRTSCNVHITFMLRHEKKNCRASVAS